MKVLLLCVFCFSLAAQAETPGWHETQLQHDGHTRHYRYYIPEAVSRTGHNPPLVILLHGGTQSMRKIMRRHAGGSQHWPTLADENGFVLLTPKAPMSKPATATATGRTGTTAA